MLNRIVLMGRLTRDPELRQTPNGVSVASFTLAVDRAYTSRDSERQTDFIDCVAWRGTGEFISKYFTKGQMCAVEGRLQIRDWTDKDGNKRRSAEVVVDNASFTESKRSREGSDPMGSYSAPSSYAPSYTAPAPSGFSELDDGDDGDLPF